MTGEGHNVIDSTTAHGFIQASSTATEIKVAMMQEHNSSPIVGQMIFLDQPMNDGFTYRCVATVTSVMTENQSLNDMHVASVLSRGVDIPSGSADIKTLHARIQATYRSDDNGETWGQVGAGLPTSPSTRATVHVLREDQMTSLLGLRKSDCVYIGQFRGMDKVNVPMLIPGFTSRRGATHQAIVGRSGSGKTGLGHTVFFAQMKNESHSFIVIDPQGQWSSENGFLFSLQKAAQALGRDVNVLRVSEDIRLPLRDELLAHLMDELKLWSKMTRMGDENSRALSEEVAKRVIRQLRAGEEKTSTELLLEALRDIQESRAALGRIYARAGESGDNLRRVLASMTGVPLTNRQGEVEELEDEDLDDGRDILATLMPRFTPLINLFQRKNLNGGDRHALGGPRGFLTGVLRPRDHSEVGAYVVLDMSSDTRLNARAQYARSVARVGVSVDANEEAQVQMRAMLDNPDVKARIVNTVLDEVKKRAETAYAEGGGNLDTQIIFDEAWRYAPNPSTVTRGSAIHALTTALAGYALDTRKYGIGWTYILQSPSDLHQDIWGQLTYVYVGHGMVSRDRKLLSDLMDDSNQLRLYDQFSDPNATGDYPFMVTGPLNPLIFTAAPTFFNVFNSPAQLLEANAEWLDDICDRRGLPRFSANPSRISIGDQRRRTVTSPPAKQPADNPASEHASVTAPLVSRPPF